MKAPGFKTNSRNKLENVQITLSAAYLESGLTESRNEYFKKKQVEYETCEQFVNFVEENIELETEYATKEMYTKFVSEYEVSCLPTAVRQA